jgi:hypothetical protein
MNIDTTTFNSFVYLVGEITLIFIASAFIVAFILVVISLYSIKKGKLYFPQLIRAGLSLLESLMKAMFRFLGLEDREMLSFFIKLQNAMNTAGFERIPASSRAIFMPQCLRSSRCPAHLTPEGLKCCGCGQCSIGVAGATLEKLGYRIFIVPGSSFIKRMVRKYRPEGIIGIGCLAEVKEGIEMADRMGLVVMGVVTLKEGCVETLVNWLEVYEVALLGIDSDSVPQDLHGLSN